jgi:transcriptional regulator with XRE-family HTH domain
MKFHEALDYLLNINNLNQADLSRKTGIDPSVISRWKNPDKEPGKKSVRKINNSLTIGSLFNDGEMWSVVEDPRSQFLLSQVERVEEQGSAYTEHEPDPADPVQQIELAKKLLSNALRELKRHL